MDIAVLDIGGTAVKYGLYHRGALCRRGQIDTLGERGAADVLQRAGDALEKLGSFDAIGVSTRGQITREGVVYFDTEDIRSWSKTPVTELLQARFSIPVATENDVNCMVWPVTVANFAAVASAKRFGLVSGVPGSVGSSAGSR